MYIGTWVVFQELLKFAEKVYLYRFFSLYRLDKPIRTTFTKPIYLHKYKTQQHYAPSHNRSCATITTVISAAEATRLTGLPDDKNSNFGLVLLASEWKIWIFWELIYGYFGNFKSIWYNLPPFGIFCGNLVYISQLVCDNKINLATLHVNASHMTT
jgi:hypothetical protein